MTPTQTALDALDKADAVINMCEGLPPVRFTWANYQHALSEYRQAAAEARKMLQPGYAQKEIIRKGGIDRRGKQ